MRFELDEAQEARLDAWLQEQNVAAVAKQRAEVKNPDKITRQMWDEGYPYTGAIGGVLTYCFTPTSVANVVVVRHGITGAELDLSDYESW